MSSKKVSERTYSRHESVGFLLSFSSLGICVSFLGHFTKGSNATGDDTRGYSIAYSE